MSFLKDSISTSEYKKNGKYPAGPHSGIFTIDDKTYLPARMTILVHERDGIVVDVYYPALAPEEYKK